MADTKTIKVMVVGDSSSAQASFKALRREAGATDKHMSGMGAAMVKWGARGAIALGAATTAAGALGLKTASGMQQARIAFTNMLGDGKKADAFLKQLEVFAAHTPFEFPDLVKSTQRLMAMGFAAKDVIPTLTAVGDAASAMGGGAESIQFITRALGQMQAKGKVSGEELRQLSEQGIPAIKYLADAYGKTTFEMSKMVAKGLVPADKGIAIITKGMEKGSKTARGFGGMMSEQAKTIQGRWSTLKDEITMMLGRLVEKAFPLLGKAMEMATIGIRSFIKGISGARDSSDGFAGIMNKVGLAVKAVVDWVIQATKFYKEHKDTINTFIAVLGVLLTLYGAWTIAQTILNAVLNANPIFLVITGLAILVTAFIRAYQTSATFRRVVDTAWRVISAVIKWAWNNVIRPIWNALVAYVKVMIAVYSALWTGVKKVWSWIGSAISTAWNRVIKPVFSAIKTGVGKVKDAFNNAKDGIGKAWSAIKAAVGKPVQWVINTVVKGITDKYDWLAGKLPGVPKINFKGVNWKFASGGVLPGYTPGKDVHQFYNPKLGWLNLSGGEAIMRPEFTRMVGGPAGVARLNAASRGYADGGVWGAITGFLAKPINLFKGFVDRIKGNDLGMNLGRGVAKKLVTGFVDKVKEAFGFGDGGGFGGGGSFGTGGNVNRWSGLVARALVELGQSLMWVPAILRRISMESGGNPMAVNRWDSNARAGTPSMGLMQTIGPTFLAYAGKYRGLGPYNPFANIYAGINYALHAYGSLGRIDPRVRPYGYDSGGMLPPGLSLAYNGTGRPEPVGHDLKNPTIHVHVNVEGNVVTERDLVKAVTLGVRDELLRHSHRNGGRTGLPTR